MVGRKEIDDDEKTPKRSKLTFDLNMPQDEPDYTSVDKAEESDDQEEGKEVDDQEFNNTEPDYKSGDKAEESDDQERGKEVDDQEQPLEAEPDYMSGDEAEQTDDPEEGKGTADKQEVFEQLEATDNQLRNEIDHDYFDSLPPGYRFCPFDHELVVHYLKKKVLDQPLPKNRIMDVELYEHNPETLAEKYKACGEKEWYFFTSRAKKYKHGSRPSRSTPDGYWKVSVADKPIKYKGDIVGFKQALNFYLGKARQFVKTNWIMHEFRVNDPSNNNTKDRKGGDDDMMLDKWVLCRIYNKTDKPSVQYPYHMSGDEAEESDDPEEGEGTVGTKEVFAQGEAADDQLRKYKLEKQAKELEAKTRNTQELDHTIQELDRTNRHLSDELEAERRKIQALDRINCCLLDRIQEETNSKLDLEEKLKNASKTIEDLRERLKQQEGEGSSKQ